MHKHPLVDTAFWCTSPNELISLFVSVDNSSDFKSSVSEVSYPSPQFCFSVARIINGTFPIQLLSYFSVFEITSAFSKMDKFVVFSVLFVCFLFS